MGQKLHASLPTHHQTITRKVPSSPSPPRAKSVNPLLCHCQACVLPPVCPATFIGPPERVPAKENATKRSARRGRGKKKAQIKSTETGERNSGTSDDLSCVLVGFASFPVLCLSRPGDLVDSNPFTFFYSIIDKGHNIRRLSCLVLGPLLPLFTLSPPSLDHDHNLDLAMSGNTVRGTPNRGQPRGAIPFNNSPAANSSIPRPVLDNHSHVGSDAGAAPGGGGGAASSVSASRQKQSKRDEVGGLPLILEACAHIMPLTNSLSLRPSAANSRAT